MRPETFLEKFNLIADAPGAVMHFRHISCSIEIAAERWPQESLESVSTKITDGTHQTPKYVETGIPFVSVKDFSGGALDMSGTRFITPEEHSLIYKRCDPKRGDILLGRIGTIGKAVVVDTDIEFSLFVSAAQIRPDKDKILSRFLQYVLNSTFCRTQFDEIKVGGATHTNKLNLKDLRLVKIPLPPLAEQKRIVAKVDELMTLCDQLEQQQKERDAQHAALSRASFTRFTESPTPENLNLLFHPSYTTTPAELRKTILTLAVQGKLVPQAPNDETAEELVSRIASTLPNKKSENPFLEKIEASVTDESEYELPIGWAWLPLGQLGIWATGCGFPTHYQGQSNQEFLFCKVSDMNLPGNEVEIHTTVHSIDADVMMKIKARANPVGTVIFPKIGGAIATHKRRLVIKPTIIDNNCSGIRPIGLTDERWLLLFMRNLDLTKLSVWHICARGQPRCSKCYSHWTSTPLRTKADRGQSRRTHETRRPTR